MIRSFYTPQYVNPRRRALLMMCGVPLSVLVLSGCVADQSADSGTSEPAVHATNEGQEVLALSARERTTLRERSIEYLERAALDADPLMRANAIEAFEHVPTRAAGPVRSALADVNPGVRFAAAMTAGRLRLRDTIPALQPMTTDPSLHVQLAAIYALDRLGQRVDVQPLSEALESRDLRLRSQAAFVLGEMGNPSAVPMLQESALNAPTGAIPVQRTLFDLQVAEARLKLGDREAADAVRSALYPASVDGFEAAVLAVQIIGQQQIGEATLQLIALVEERVPVEGGPTRWKDQDQSLPALYPIELRLAAATGLAELGYFDGHVIGIESAESPDPLVRAQSAMLLGAMSASEPKHTNEALITLRTMLDDPVRRVQIAAASGVVRFMSSK